MSPKGRYRYTLLLVFYALLGVLPQGNSFYVPGVAPREFKPGEPIDIKAIKLTSTRVLFPYDYYSLPFCRPPKGELHYKSENLGEIMRGDRIVNTPFEIAMKTEEKCMQLCFDNGKTTKLSGTESNLLRKRITEDYHVHLLVDNLPSATKFSIPETGEIFYDHGYRLGWMDGDKIFLNNHLEIILKYHEPTKGVYRVVGFEVQPRSVHHSVYSLNKACSIEKQNNQAQELLPDAENVIVWSYSVTWESSDIPWASRWDIYLSMKDVQIHWFSIFNSIVVVICLAGFLSVIIIRTVRRDIAKYNRDDEEEALEESGWKLVHGDVFRPPKYTMLFVNITGTGIQLFGMVGITVSFAMLGMLSPSSRGSLATVAIFLYCFMGLIAGYYSGRLYKTLRGTKMKRCAIRTALLFPGIVMGSGFIINLFLMWKHSSGALPFTTMAILLFLWFGVDLPLVYVGFHFGFRKKMYSHPVRTNQIPRQVPDPQPWYLNTLPCMALAGILPFGAVFIELYFIFSAIWENQFYYLFGFLFIVLAILYISCGQIAIVVTYFLLCAENYHWWWKSFAISGGSALYVLGYSVFYYYTKLSIVGFVPTLLYFIYSFLIAVTFWLLTGTIGFYAAYYFVRKIYAAVKID